MRKSLVTLLLLNAAVANAQNGEPGVNARPAVANDTSAFSATAVVADTIASSTTPIDVDTIGNGFSTLAGDWKGLFGYLSYDAVLKAMPQYSIVQQHMKELREAYEAELKRVEDEFNQKYEDFLEGRADYPRTILLKRQNELQDLLQQNVAFRNRSLEELRQAEADALAPLRQQLLTAVATVAQEKGFAFVLNTDRDATLFIDPTTGVNITEYVLSALESTK